jgi:hypothetical protein
MPAAMLSLLFLAQQILLPDTLDRRWRQDVMNAGRQEWHRLNSVPELDAMFGRGYFFPIFVVLALDHLPNFLHNA